MSNVNNNSNSNWRPLQSPDPQLSQNLRGTTRIAGTPHSQATGAPSRAADVIGPLTGSQADYNNNLDTLFGSASGSLSTGAAPMEQPQESRAFETWYDSIWNDPQPPAQIADQAKAKNQSRDGSNLASTASTTTPADRHIRRPLQPGTYKHGPLNVGPITRKYALLQDPHLKLHARVLDPYSRQGPAPQTQPSNRQPAPNDDSSQDYTSGSESSDYDSSALTWESDGEQSPAERIHERGGAEFPAADPIDVPGSSPWAGDDLPIPAPIPFLPPPKATTPSNNRDLADRSVEPQTRTNPSALRAEQEFRKLQADLRAGAYIARADLRHPDLEPLLRKSYADPMRQEEAYAPAITDPQSNLSATPAPASIKSLKSRKVKLASGRRSIHTDDPSEIPAFQKLSYESKQTIRDKLLALRNEQKYEGRLGTADFVAMQFIYRNYYTTLKELGLVFGKSAETIAKYLRD